jgi:two-component system, OmpR family, sensor kinase
MATPGQAPAPAHALRTRLLGWLLAAVCATAAAQAWVAYHSALGQADEIFDYHMQQAALSLRSGLPVTANPQRGRVPTSTEDDDFVIQVWSARGEPVFQSVDLPTLPQQAVLGYSDTRLGGTHYRVFALSSPTHVIQVAQDMGVRQAMARRLAWRTLMPLAVMVPLLMLMVWWIIRNSLAPLARVRAQVARRQPQDLSEVSEAGLPEEVQPLIHELNQLFARLRLAFDAQTRFVADAAHELRSPLAALKLQAQGLQRARDEATRERAAARLVGGIDRAARLVEQLLSLARQQAQLSEGPPAQAVDLRAVAAEGVAAATRTALERQHDLGLSQADEGEVSGHVDALRMLLRNLIDNAIKYSPPGGRIDVRVQRLEGAMQLVVEDSGPGIAAADREQALARFHRLPSATAGTAEGSGLGLAIVQAISEGHGAGLVLGHSDTLGGLAVTVRFPAPLTTAARATPRL